MANLKDLKEVGDRLLPVIKDLFAKSANDEEKRDTRSEQAVLEKLRKLVSEASKVTEAPVGERSEAIVAMRTALTEILIQAAQHDASLSDAQVRTIQAQRNALRNSFGLLLERAAFEPIAKLLSRNEIDRIAKQLKGARKEIQKRRKAKKILDTTTKIALVAAKIATKVAVL